MTHVGQAIDFVAFLGRGRTMEVYYGPPRWRAGPNEFEPVRRRTVRKWGSQRLGAAIAAKVEARADQTPRKSAAARDRRRLRRGSKRRNAKGS